MLKPMLGEAWHAMGSNPMRTALTMLGMVIGVGSGGWMMGVGQGARLAGAGGGGVHHRDVFHGLVHLFLLPCFNEF